MTELVQAIVLGLLVGGVYALLASGLTLIFGVMNVINVAQGALPDPLGIHHLLALVGVGLDPLAAIADHDVRRCSCSAG